MSERPQRRPRRPVDGILLLDKPLGLSSNAALQRAKRVFQADKAGHTGSLDPLASGLLPLCFGEATKLSSFLLDADKTYVARVRLGAATATGDAEGEVVAHSDPSGVSVDAIQACIPGMLGPQRQVPPMYSALKRDGRPLYELAREGIEIEREARDIHIHDLRVTSCALPEFEFEVRCSKGTYVRTLAEDWAAKLGQVGHLVALRRTALGGLSVSDAVTLDALEDTAGLAVLDARLLPMRAAVADWPMFEADDTALVALSHGRSVPLTAGTAEGRRAIVDSQGRLRGLAEVGPDGRLQPRRWFADRQKA